MPDRRVLSFVLIAAIVAACSGGTASPAKSVVTSGAFSAAATPTAAPASAAASSAASTVVPGTPATAAPTAREFVSDHYGFAITLPSDWHEQDANIDWPGVYLEGQGSPEFANFVDARGDRTLLVASATVPSGTRLTDWQAAMVRGTSPLCEESQTTESTMLGGEPALAWTAKCSDGYDVNKLAALHGHRGFVMYLPSDTANSDTEDRRVFEEIRTSLRFTR